MCVVTVVLHICIHMCCIWVCFDGLYVCKGAVSYSLVFITYFLIDTIIFTGGELSYVASLLWKVRLQVV